MPEGRKRRERKKGCHTIEAVEFRGMKRNEQMVLRKQRTTAGMDIASPFYAFIILKITLYNRGIKNVFWKILKPLYEVIEVLKVFFERKFLSLKCKFTMIDA